MRRGLNAARFLAITALFLCAHSAVVADPPPPAEKPEHPGALVGEDAAEAKKLQDEIDEHDKAGEWKEAAAVARQLLDLRRAKQGEKHWETVSAWWQDRTAARMARESPEFAGEYQAASKANSEGEEFSKKHKYLEAQSAFETALNIRRRVLGEDHPEIIYSYTQAAFNLYAQGKYNEAVLMFEKALAISKRIYDGDHRTTLTCFNNLGSTLLSASRHREPKRHLPRLSRCHKESWVMSTATRLSPSTIWPVFTCLKANMWRRII